MKQHLIRNLEALIARAAGRHYQINLELLDEASLREFVRLMHDLAAEQRNAVYRARTRPSGLR